MCCLYRMMQLESLSHTIISHIMSCFSYGKGFLRGGAHLLEAKAVFIIIGSRRGWLVWDQRYQEMWWGGCLEPLTVSQTSRYEGVFECMQLPRTFSHCEDLFFYKTNSQ